MVFFIAALVVVFIAFLVITYIAAHIVVIATTVGAAVVIGGPLLLLLIIVFVRGLDKRTKVVVRPRPVLPAPKSRPQLPSVSASYDPSKPPPPNPFSSGEPYIAPAAEPVEAPVPAGHASGPEKKTCAGPRCHRPLPKSPWRVGVSPVQPGEQQNEPPEEDHEFCSEWCMNQWIKEDKAARAEPVSKPRHSRRLIARGSR